MPQYHAAWLLPIAQPPIRHGWVRVEGGRITALGQGPIDSRVGRAAIDLGNVALLPGLVNAHTHLELSWMRARVPASSDFPSWLRDVVALQRSGSATPETTTAAMDDAVAEARATGTTVFGDISNTLASAAPLVARRVPSVIFHELIGFQHGRAEALIDEATRRLRALPQSAEVRYALAAHAPYSVSPSLFNAIKVAAANRQDGRCSVHLGESMAEWAFLQDGSGPWRTLLERLGSWDPSWTAPGCDPVEYLDRLGYLDSKTLVVHGVQFGERELARLAGTGATLVTCPRGNRLTGAGIPPIFALYAAGIPVAVGTDSLASVPDLNMFSELAELRRLAPTVPPSTLLESATLTGARALGVELDHGSLANGKRASLIAVSVPPDVTDVEEYLVSGIARADISIVDGADVE